MHIHELIYIENRAVFKAGPDSGIFTLGLHLFALHQDFYTSYIFTMDHEETASRMICQLYDRVHYMNQATKEQTKFTPDELMALRLSWNAWVAGDLAGRGFDSFVKMFEQRKETKEVFSFARGNDAKQMQQSSNVLFHVTRVMKNIDEVVKHADRLEDVVSMLRQVGGRHGHQGHNVPSAYFPFLGEAMRTLIKANYKAYDSKLDDCWVRLWNFINTQMTTGQEIYGGGKI